MKILRMHNDWTKNERRRKENSFGGCGYYRVKKIAEQLSPEHEVDFWGREWHDLYEEFKLKYKNPEKTNEEFFGFIFQTYDMVWLHYINNPTMFAWMRVAADKYGKKLVMDIDDNFLDVNESNPAIKEIGGGQYKIKKGKYHATDATRKVTELAAMFSLCDAITVSTVPLKEKLHEHFQTVHGIDVPIFVVPNANDINDWTFEPVAKKEGIVIGYMGGVSHHDDLKVVLPAIKEIMEKYEFVGFQLMGQLTFKDAKKVFKGWPQALRSKVIMVSPTSTFQEFPEWMSLQPWDIGIAPLTQDAFNECKSHIKWMEYSMYEIPTIASRVYPYYKDVLGRPTIEDGETGMLCEKDDWVNIFTALIEDEGLRLSLGKNAKEAIIKNWQYSSLKPHILKVVEEIRSL